MAYPVGKVCGDATVSPENITAFGGTVYVLELGTGYGTVDASGAVTNYPLFCSGAYARCPDRGSP